MTKHKSFGVYFRLKCRDADENRWENYRTRVTFWGELWFMERSMFFAAYLNSLKLKIRRMVNRSEGEESVLRMIMN